MKAFLDEGYPFINVNSPLSSVHGNDPLLIKMCNLFRYRRYPWLHIHEKIKLVLERGADVNVRAYYGQTCLHLALDFKLVRPWTETSYDEPIFRDILMLLITAGADVMAVNFGGQNVHEVAVSNG